MKPAFLSIFLMMVALFLLFSIGVALTAANSVSTSGLTDQSFAVTVAQIEPSQCSALGLTNIQYVTSGVPFVSTGTTNDLIIGTAAADDITAGKGQDCVVGGDGDDIIVGDQGVDVLLGGPGNDDLNGGPGNDTLDGGADTDVCSGGGGGANTFVNCETIN